MTDDQTTLVCLFHHPRQAEAALEDLGRAGVPASAISVIGNRPGGLRGIESGEPDFRAATLAELGIPERDLSHLSEGVQAGGTVIAVNASQEHVGTVEHVFERNQATVMDEAVVNRRAVAPAPVPFRAAAESSIPIVEEELVIGKRIVDRGGVRVYRRIVEMPAEAAVGLRAEHIHVDRQPADRAVTERDLALQGEQTIELTETAEEAVVSKRAHVIEEVRISKDFVEHTEAVHETVRHTEVKVEEIRPDTISDSAADASQPQILTPGSVSQAMAGDRGNVT